MSANSAVEDDICRFLEETKIESLDLKTKELVKTIGWEAAARTLGYDVKSFKQQELAGKMLMYNIRKHAPKDIIEYAKILKGRLSPMTIDYINRYTDVLQPVLDANSKNDYLYAFFEATVWQRNYLFKLFSSDMPSETPQLLFMRLAIQFYHDISVDAVIRCYLEMSQMKYTHASPTMFNAGTMVPSMSSCFLGSIQDDRKSISYHGVHEPAMISSFGGGLGLDLSRLRHSEVGVSTGYVGVTRGLVPVCYLYNANIRMWDQKGKRKGAETVMTRSHHIDIFQFSELSDPTGDHYARAHDLNTSILTSWEFWKRIEQNGDWTLFCPKYTKKLNDIYGEAFSKQYREYEAMAKAGTLKPLEPSTIIYKVVKARKLLEHIIDIQRKSGMPYMMNWDACNFKSNHRHLGYIRGTNLCQEIVQHVGITPDGHEEFAVCNLASISFRTFAKPRTTDGTIKIDDLFRYIDFESLGPAIRSLVRNLNQVIEYTHYETPGSRYNNMRHRPVGIGAQGFAELLYILDVNVEHPATLEINKALWACMYFNALIESVEQAIQHGEYESFKGSPLSEGKFQFDLWAEEYQYLKANDYLVDDSVRREEDDLPIDPVEWRQSEITLSNGHVVSPTWDSLRQAVMKYGTRNSLLLTAMPTASSSNIMGNTETVEMPQQNIFSRSIMGGSYMISNRYLQRDLTAINCWNRYTIDLIQSDTGSISKLNNFIKSHPEWYPRFNDWSRLSHLQKKYKTMWEISQKLFLKMAADRGRYIDQSQSTNVYLADPTVPQMVAMLRYGNRLGLKTLMYYLRRLAGNEPIKFTVSPDIQKYVNDTKVADMLKIEEAVGPVCTMEAGCISCSS